MRSTLSPIAEDMLEIGRQAKREFLGDPKVDPDRFEALVTKLLYERFPTTSFLPNFPGTIAGFVVYVE